MLFENTDAAKLQRRLRPLRDLEATPDALRLHEIYASIQGESSFCGLPCIFVRTTACHLRCTYCDTRAAFGGGDLWTLAQIHTRIDSLGPKLVLITGGEPLLQKNVLPLMQALCDRGYTVCIETSGALDITAIDPRVIRIVDVKTPSSGEAAANLEANFAHLRPHDEIKFVIGDAQDYAWSCEYMTKHHLADKCHILFGPVWSKLAPADLAAWIVRDRLPVRMQIQTHKYIWGANTQGV